MAVTFDHAYGPLDRWLHALAFSGIEVQKLLADIEDRVFARGALDHEVDRPVFITSLPRAGTTLLLDLVAGTGAFAVHRYRDLPFLLCPVLWRKLSRRFEVRGEMRERAHGDGMTVGFDSAEAFEEVLWCAFWPEKYLDDRIVPWSASDRDAYAEFAGFFRRHILKLIGREPGAPRRYASKNNANIARLAKLRALFPDAMIVVPFRNPVDHVGSMVRQHANFTALHDADPFTKRYMRDIGHFDFGRNFRPIDIGGWLSRTVQQDRMSAAFWLEYWCAAFEHCLAGDRERLVFLDYDELCQAPEAVLTRLGAAIGVADDRRLVDLSRRLRPSPRYDRLAAELSPALLERATVLHHRLRATKL